MIIPTDFERMNNKLKKERRIKLILFILCVIFTIAALILITSYVIMENKLISTQLCESDLCMRSAATLRLAMNLSVDPCEDFYNFACGRWTSEHPDHGWFSPVSAFNLVDETLTAAILKFLYTNVTKHEPLPVTQSRHLYSSCMNTDKANKLGFKPIFKYLSLVGLPAIPTYMNLTENKYTEINRFNWIRTDALMTRLIGLQTFVGFTVECNPTNTSQHFIKMGSSPLINYQLPRFSNQEQHRYFKSFRYLKEHGNNEGANNTNISEEKIRQMIYDFTYSVVAANLSEYTNLPANFSIIVNKTVDALWELRNAITLINTIDEPPENCNNSVECGQFFELTINELQDHTNNILLSLNITPIEIWNPYLLQVFDNLNLTLDFKNNETISTDVYNLEYLISIVVYLCKLPDALIELWLWWRIVLRLIFNTTTEMREYGYDLSSPTFDKPEHLKCVGITNKYMGMAVSYAIADKIIQEDTRRKVEDMILDIKTAFTERIKQIKWMDEKTKILTMEKCKEMLSLVGYPEWLMDQGALEKYYSNIIIHPETYLDNLISIIQRNVRTELEKLHAPHNRNWPDDTFPITVNAYHVPSDNSIIVPMAFLFFPLYNLGLEVLNYAATGCTLGHELIHGFDDTGRQFDKFGNNLQWWDQEVVDKFEDLAQCFVDQYNKFYVPEAAIYVNGEVSLGENIADNDGLRLAYMAYKKFKKRNKRESKLPGLEQYTDDQIFFIAYASTWCDEIKQDNKNYVEEEPHCPKMYRLIGSLQNSKEFAHAFHCKKGSKMNPALEKCSIW